VDSTKVVDALLAAVKADDSPARCGNIWFSLLAQVLLGGTVFGALELRFYLFIGKLIYKVP